MVKTSQKSEASSGSGFQKMVGGNWTKVLAGEEIAISYGKSKEIVARLVPKIPAKKHLKFATNTLVFATSKAVYGSNFAL